MGDGLLIFSGVETLTGATSSTSLSLGQEDSLLDIFLPYVPWSSQLEKSLRDTGSIMGLLPFHNSPFIFYSFIVVLLR